MAKATIEATRPSAARRLHDALATLLRQQPDGESSKPLTALALCRLAGVSRNALYRYHPDVLLSLHEAQSCQRARPAAKRIARLLRQENRELRDQLTQLAALVDHYFAAWQEARLQLERRDREVAELRRGGHRPQVVPFRH